MFEYQLQFLRTNDPFSSKEEAIQFLNSYKYHLIGQPICVYYTSDATSEVLSLLAVGRKNGEGVFNGKEYYDIINSTNVQEVRPESLYWGTLN